MALLDQVRRIIGGASPKSAAQLGVSEDTFAKLALALEEEVSIPPRIAIIGETGVGKTSTINALFNSGLPISHVRACTQEEIEILTQGGHPVRIVDMPGLGEDIAADRRHIETYRRVLPGSDLVLWVLKADNRAMTHVQTSLRRLIRLKLFHPRQLVVAINQVDLLQPGSWDDAINQPSPEQEESIAERRDDITAKIRNAVPRLPDRQVVPYSATKFYNLEALFEAVLQACGETRRWVVAERGACADFNQLVRAGTVNQEKTE